MARPKLRTETIRVRFTPDELSIARRKAEREGVPLSTYLRRLAVTSQTGTAASEERDEEKQERIRRALAAFGSLSKREADELREDVQELRKAWARDRR